MDTKYINIEYVSQSDKSDCDPYRMGSFATQMSGKTPIEYINYFKDLPKLSINNQSDKPKQYVITKDKISFLLTTLYCLILLFNIICYIIVASNTTLLHNDRLSFGLTIGELKLYHDPEKYDGHKMKLYEMFCIKYLLSLEDGKIYEKDIVESVPSVDMSKYFEATFKEMSCDMQDEINWKVTVEIMSYIVSCITPILLLFSNFIRYDETEISIFFKNLLALITVIALSLYTYFLNDISNIYGNIYDNWKHAGMKQDKFFVMFQIMFIANITSCIAFTILWIFDIMFYQNVKIEK